MTEPKCELDYSNEFKIFNTEIKSFIAEILKDTFLINNFKNVSLNSIVYTLALNAQLKADALLVDYLKIVTYEKKEHRPYGEGMGVIGFSRIYFNKNTDKAILFYEFGCGPKCGTGEVVFINKMKDKWRIVMYKRVWDS